MTARQQMEEIQNKLVIIDQRLSQAHFGGASQHVINQLLQIQEQLRIELTELTDIVYNQSVKTQKISSDPINDIDSN
jgi:hypothetical protein